MIARTPPARPPPGRPGTGKTRRGERAAARVLAGLLHGQADAAYPVHLARAGPAQRAAARDRDRVRLDVLDAPPGEQQLRDFLVGRATLRGHDQIVGPQRPKVARLHEQPADHALQVQPLPARPAGQRIHSRSAQVRAPFLFLGQDGQHAVFVAGRDDRLEKRVRAGDALGGRPVQRAVHGQDAAEGATRVASRARANASASVSASAQPQGWCA
jgi:hypothetical protein